MSMTVSVFLNPCVPVRQTEDESSFPLCRWHSHGKYSCFRICRIRKASATHADILMWSKCNTRWYSHVLLYWILFYSILIYFLFVSFTPTLSVSPISPSPYGSLSFPLCDGDGSCLLPHTQTTLHGSPKQFSANGNLQYCMLKPSGCCWWSVVGDWCTVYESWSGEAKERTWKNNLDSNCAYILQ